MNFTQCSKRICAVAAALVWTSPTAAQSPISSRYQEFLSEKPPLHLTEPQRKAVVEAVARQKTYQRTPKDFEPQIGMTIKTKLNSHPMPRPLIYEIPVLRQYYYAKLDRNVLVIDPTKKQIVDVIPRKWPAATSEPANPAGWAATRGRELLGLPPEPMPQTTGQSNPSRSKKQ